MKKIGILLILTLMFIIPTNINALNRDTFIIGDLLFTDKVAGKKISDRKMVFIKLLVKKGENTNPFTIQLYKNNSNHKQLTFQDIESTKDNLKDKKIYWETIINRFAFPQMIDENTPEIVNITETGNGQKYAGKSSGEYYVYNAFIGYNDSFNDKDVYSINMGQLGINDFKCTYVKDYEGERCLVNSGNASGGGTGTSIGETIVDDAKDPFYSANVAIMIGKSIKFENTNKCVKKNEENYNFSMKLIYQKEDTPFNNGGETFTTEQRNAMHTATITEIGICQSVNIPVPNCKKITTDVNLSYTQTGSGVYATTNSFTFNDIDLNLKWAIYAKISYIYKDKRYTNATANYVIDNFKICDNNDAQEIVDNNETAPKPDNPDEVGFGSMTKTCGKLSYELIKFGYDILDFIKIVAVILVIILGSLDFVKATTSGDADANKKAMKNFRNRLIAAVSLFILPVLIKFILINFQVQGTDPTDPLCENYENKSTVDNRID